SSGGSEILSGGVASATKLNGGTLTISAGSALATVLSSGGAVQVFSGADSATTVQGGGTVNGFVGGLTRNDVLVGSGAGVSAQEVVNTGAVASGAILSNTALLIINSGGRAVSTVVISTNIGVPGSNGSLIVNGGGVASNTLVSGLGNVN